MSEPLALALLLLSAGAGPPGPGASPEDSPPASPPVSPPASPQVSPDRPRLGDLVRVDVSLAEGPAPASVFAFGCAQDFHRQGDQATAFVAVPTDTSTGAHALEIEFEGGRRLRLPVQIQPRQVEVTELKVDRKFTGKRSEKLQARLDEEAASIEAMWRRPTRLDAVPLALGTAVRPVPGAPSSRFGNQRRFNGRLKSEHYGLDLRGRTGTPVLSALPGVVALSADRWGSGGTVYVDHGAGLLTGYFHLSARDVEVGEHIDAGQRLGAVGATGRVTGPHLHWAAAVRCLTSEGGFRGMYVDPAPLLQAD